MNNSIRDIVFSGIVTVRDRLLQLPDPLRLESGEPSFDTPTHIKEAMIKALGDNQTHYAPSTGIKPLREACLKKLIDKNGHAHLNDPSQVVITNGGMHALYVTFQTILNDGDEVIVPRPNWTATGWIIRMSGGKLINVPLQAELGYRWNIEQIKAAITPRTKAILVNSPHNPTGGVFQREDYRAILKLAEQHQLYVVSDEAYEDIVYDTEHISLGSVASEFSPETRDRIISCFTFSKSYAMTGWRLGYVACSSAQFAEQVKKMILYTINGVSTATQYGGIAALEGPQDCVREMVTAYRERRDILFDGVNQTEFLECTTPPGGAFYLYAKIKPNWEKSAWDLVNHLIDTYALGSVPGEVFSDNQPSIRFSYACSTAMVRRAIEKLTSPVPA